MVIPTTPANQHLPLVSMGSFFTVMDDGKCSMSFLTFLACRCFLSLSADVESSL
jgi:hypothetical protein